VAPLVFDQRQDFIGCSNNGLLEFPEISECFLAGRWRGSAGKFNDDEWMAQYLIHRDQRLKNWIREPKMCNPD
jgi:hypothetical protein